MSAKQEKPEKGEELVIAPNASVGNESSGENGQNPETEESSDNNGASDNNKPIASTPSLIPDVDSNKKGKHVESEKAGESTVTGKSSEMKDAKDKEEKEPAKAKINTSASSLNELVNEAVASMNKKVLGSVQQWISEKLKIGSPLPEIQPVYDSLLAEAVNVKIEKSDQNQFNNLVNSAGEQSLLPKLGAFRSALQQFNSSMVDLLKLHQCLAPAKLLEMGHSESENISKSLDDHNMQLLFSLAVTKMMDQFRQQNEEIISAEMGLCGEVVVQLILAYEEEIEAVLSKGVYSNEDLLKVHMRLVEDLSGALKDSFGLRRCSNHIRENLDKEVASLKEYLETRFESYLEENKINLQNQASFVAKAIRKSKTFYVEKCEEILNGNPEGLPPPKLERLHMEVARDSKRLLDKAIAESKRPNEPVQAHVSALQAYIESYWISVEEENEENLKNAPKKMSPLVFHIRPRCIKMGILEDGKPRVLEHSKGEVDIPLIVGWDRKKGRFIYGNEVLRRQPETDGKFWWVTETLAKPTKIFSENIRYVDGKSTTVTSEFLLGLILRHLKTSAESKLNGACTCAVIAIPLWFNCVARMQIKLGGQVAGFSEVHLVSETSAGAFCFLSHQTSDEMEEENVFFLSERTGDGAVDATVFSYFPKEKLLRMIGHSENYILKDKLKPFRVAKGAGNDDWPSQGQGTKSKFGSLGRRNKVAEKLKETNLDNFEFQHSKTGYVVLLGETSEWKNNLKRVGQTFFQGVRIDIAEENAVLSGAALLSPLHGNISIRVQDMVSFDLEVMYKGPSTMTIGKVQTKCKTLNSDISIPIPGRSIEIFQIYGNQERLKVGELTVVNSLINGDIEAHFRFSNEVILELNSVLIKEGEKEMLAEAKDYKWESYGMEMEPIKEQLNSLVSAGKC